MNNESNTLIMFLIKQLYNFLYTEEEVENAVEKLKTQTPP